MTTPTDNITCPLCSSRGWPSSITMGAYAADCGSQWGTFIEHRQTPACRIIAGLRFEIDLLMLSQETAA